MSRIQASGIRAIQEFYDRMFPPSGPTLSPVLAHALLDLLRDAMNSVTMSAGVAQYHVQAWPSSIHPAMIEFGFNSMDGCFTLGVNGERIATFHRGDLEQVKADLEQMANPQPPHA